MSENMNYRGGREGPRMTADDPQQVDYLRSKFGVTTQKIIDAIHEVGNDREKVERFLRENVGFSSHHENGDGRNAPR